MKRRIRIFFALLCIIGISVTSVSTMATDYDKEIEEAKEEQEKSEKKAEKLQEEIDEIESDREDVMSYIEKLDKKTSELEEEMADLEPKIKKAKKELKTIQKELDAAKEEEDKQYITMTKRIKYMYENGNQEYIDILFGATSISDLLNRSEYIEKISDYDKNIFEEYQKITDIVQEKTDESQAKLQELTELQDELKQEKQAVKKLKANKKKQLKKYTKKLKKSQDKVDAYTKQALAAEKEVEKLLQEKQEEIDKENATGSGNSGGTSAGNLAWPLSGGAGTITSNFGPRTSPTAGASSYHKGIDIAISSGTPILASGSGKVVTATYSSSAGNYVMISHGNSLYTVYMHCSRLAVSVGDTVEQGQVIAYVGSTGVSTGSHLHFGVSKNGSYVNPLNYVSK